MHNENSETVSLQTSGILHDPGPAHLSLSVYTTSPDSRAGHLPFLSVYTSSPQCCWVKLTQSPSEVQLILNAVSDVMWLLQERDPRRDVNSL